MTYRTFPLPHTLIALALLSMGTARPTLAQSPVLEGQVSIHNSRHSTGRTLYVEGATVSALDQRDRTDAQGRFQLRLTDILPGSKVQVSVSKEGMEVTNPNDLRSVPLGGGQPLQVFMAPKGTMAQREQQLLGTGQRQLLTQRDSLLLLLRTGDEQAARVTALLSRQLGRSFENRFEAMDALLERYREMERRLPDFARELASKNLDMASDLYIEAYSLFGKGEIVEAIAVLDSTLLEHSLREGSKSLLVGQRMVDIGEELQEKGRLMVRQTIDSYALKGEAHLLRFQYKEASGQFQRIIEIHKEHGLDSLGLAQWHDRAGEAHGDNGQYWRAMEHYEQSFTIREEVLGPKHPDLAASYNNIAIVYRYLGEYPKALEYQQKAIEIQEEVLDSKHPDLAKSYSSITVTYGSLGEYQRALEYQQRAIAIEEGILGPKHPDLANAYNNIANIYRFLGEYERALEYHHRAISIRKEVLGNKHPDLASSYSNTASVYLSSGEYRKALEYNEKSISIGEEVLDPKHPDLATYNNNIANSYRLLGEYQKALEYFQKSNSIWEEVLNPGHPLLATSYSNIATIYYHYGEYQKALEYYHKGITIMEEVLDPKHPNLAISYSNIASTYRSMGEYQKSLEYQQRSITILEEVLDPEHPTLGLLYNNMANIYRLSEEYERALEYHLRAIAVQEEALGSGHPQLATSYNDIGNTYRAIGDHAKAMEYLQKALAIRKEVLPSEHPDLVASYISLGHCYYDMRQYSNALTHYQQAVAMDPKLKEKEHYNDTGLAYAKDGQLDQAKQAFEEHQRLFSEKGETYRNWALYYALLGNKEEVLAHLEKAVALGYDDLEWLQEEEAFDDIRESEGYKELIERMENARASLSKERD